MLSSFYVLRALSVEWNQMYTGATIVEAYSQNRDELALTLDTGGEAATIRAQFGGTTRYVTAHAEAGRKRRNVADVLPDAVGKAIAGVRVADRDRVLHMDLDGGWRIDIVTFGPHANAYLVDEQNEVRDTFRGRPGGHEHPPEPRPARNPLPLLTPILSTECFFRAGVSGLREDLPADAAERLSEVVEQVERECLSPEPRIYWKQERPVALSLITMRHLAEARDERYEAVTPAVHFYVRRSLAWDRFDAEFRPVSSAVDRELRRMTSRLARLREELRTPSRADTYERWGHLLMGNPHVQIHGEELELPDLFDDGRTVRIPVDAELSVQQNAQLFYEKARVSRQAREKSEERVEVLAADVEKLRRVQRELESVKDPEAWRDTKAAAPDDLRPFMTGRQRSEQSVPYRRYDLGSGFELWVGRNAAQNDELTTRVARRFDVWLHARGVGGSHAVLRPPNKSARIPEEVIERAAAVAAWHSKARGSALVPVIVAERKFVRKPRRAAPGTVVVDRHRVVMVEPRLPTNPPS